MLAPPKVILLDPAPVVRALPGFQLSCSASGYPPIYTALIKNSTVLVNTTGTATIRLYKEGNYSCVATNSYGLNAREFSVIFTGKTLSYLKCRVGLEQALVGRWGNGTTHVQANT